YLALKRLRELPMAPGTDGAPEPVYVPCTDEAAATLARWCEEESAAAPTGGNLLRSWRGKGRGHVLRLSLVFELLDWSFGGGHAPRAISATAMVRAITFYGSYLEPMAKRVFGDAALPECERDAGAIAQMIVAVRPTMLKVRD